ncbi:MAG: hypothetical protein ACRD1H_05790, partial [Vicinamibacterales bacterium]
CCFDTALGVSANLASVGDVPGGFRVNATLFGESASRIVVSAGPGTIDALLAAARDLEVPATIIGRAGGDRIRLSVEGTAVIDVARPDAETTWATAIERKMGSQGGQVGG